MARYKTTVPEQSKHPGQRSIQLPEYLVRYVPQWRHPEWTSASAWRTAVRHQPVAMSCRETLISQIVSLEWKIEPRDSTTRDENKELIEYYTNFFEDTGKYDNVQLLEYVLGDALDTPFGGCVELGWENDISAKENPQSKLRWIEPLDSGTLFPYPNDAWPVGQYVQESAGEPPRYFPAHAVNRLYMSPRNEMLRWGWGCAPPEKIYLALELISRGDRYYANLLIDTPEVGILDLGDMAESSAKSWVQSWREMLTGIDPFKIPVLYEHENPVQFISFTRSPVDMAFNQSIVRYSALVCAGYGMSLSDIGIQVATSGGDTLAGTIRQERRTRRTGLARLKKKALLFWNRMLPPALKFVYIDLDDELAVALGRARLANATAWNQLIQAGMFTAEEARQQTIADGLTSISLPEEPPEDDEAKPQQPATSPNERPGLLGRPIAPSDGGHGEVIPRSKLLDIMLQEVPEFREVFEDLEERWDTFDENTKDGIVNELQKCLDVAEFVENT